jgi:hypothetical protein
MTIRRSSNIKRGVLVAAAILGIASNAEAARAPTHREAVAIARNFGRIPPSCLEMRISTVNSSYAFAQFRAPPARSCRRYGFNGIAILRRHQRAWRSVFEASDYRCVQVPAPKRVKRDLRVPGC